MVELLRSLPNVHTLLEDPFFVDCKNRLILKQCIQSVLAKKRSDVMRFNLSPSSKNIKEEILRTYRSCTQSTIQTLVNATGVVLQTNLGRSLLHPKILEEISPYLLAYNNLEYSLAEGRRSERYLHIKHLLCTLLGCEDVLVVNNNASAVLLILNTFGKDREVVISRGELVEIGGAFRIPEVMKLSGSHLVEVGTTNKTHLKDYESAIRDQTSILMKVHQSNFQQIGFCKSVHFRDLIALARQYNLIDYYDLGSGFVKDLCKDEPSIIELCSLSPSLLSFSGDKLFGGPQAGIIVGKSQWIAKLKENQLLRALRVDKFTILALEATIRAYLNQEYEKIPTLKMLKTSLQDLKLRSEALQDLLKEFSFLDFKIQKVLSLAGGGSLPQISFQSYGLLCKSRDLKSSQFAEKLRQQGIIVRILQDHICLDVRCLLENDFERIKQGFRAIFWEKNEK